MRTWSIIALLFTAAVIVAMPISPQVTSRGVELSVDQAQAAYRHYRRAYRRGYYGGGYYGGGYYGGGYYGGYSQQPIGGGGGQRYPWY